MRNYSDEFTAHLGGEVTALCYCWVIERTDEVRLGFTNHDRDLLINDVMCSAGSGFSPFDFESHIGFALDNTQASGVLSSERISQTDVKAGKYDGAGLKIYHVNWQNPAINALIWRGYIGNITLADGAFQAELVGQAAVLERSTGRVFSRRCDASFGDDRCGVDASAYPDGTQCAKTDYACKHQFDNIVNFRGFPYLIGEDAAFAQPSEGEVMDGGSRYS